MVRWLVVIVMLGLLALEAPPALSAAPEEILARFAEPVSAQEILAATGALQAQPIVGINVWRIQYPGGESAWRAAATSAALTEWVEANGQVTASAITPDDPLYLPQQANLVAIGAAAAWEKTTGMTAPIAVLDTGIDLDHPDLAGKVWTHPLEIAANGLDDDGNGYIDDAHGWDFIAHAPDAQDQNAHGSHVAGIAAAQTNNHQGIAGLAWITPVMPLKVLDSSGSGTWADVAEAIIYAADQGARVINLSLGSSTPSQTLLAAVQYARQKGVLLVAAAGNNGGAVQYPAALPEVLAVSSVSNRGLPSTFSSYGPEVDVAAPGENIMSASSSGGYYLSSGTSMSAAHVSGLAALLWGLRPHATRDEVEQVIRATARDIWTPGSDPRAGAGRIDAAAAVERWSRYPIYCPLTFK